MLLHDARARRGSRGEELVLLADQDRSLWDAAQIAHGRARARSRARAARPRAVRAAGGDRLAPGRGPDRLAAGRGALRRARGSSRDSPVVELNRAVAVAETGAPEQALEIVEGLDLDDYQYLHSTRAELLRRLGRDR